MSPRARTILPDVATAYSHSKERYERHMSRGDTDKAEQAYSEMQDIERCVTVIETSTDWRRNRPGGDQR